MRFVLVLVLFNFTLSFGQNPWRVAYERPKCFIENQGQFDAYQNEHTGTILFAADFGKAKVFFGKKGIKYYFMDASKAKKEGNTENEYSAENFRKLENLGEHKQWERQVGKYHYQYDEVNVDLSPSSKVELAGTNPLAPYFSYTYATADGTYMNSNHIRGLNKSCIGI